MNSLNLLLVGLLFLFAFAVFGWLLLRRFQVLLSGKKEDQSLLLIQQQLGQILSNVNERLKENSEVLQKTQQSLGERLDNAARVVGNVQKSLGSLEEANRKIFDVGKDIASLQEILRAPKLRGGLGEFLLGDLLGQILPPDHFATQHAFRSGEKVDAVIKLGGSLVPVDSKFPLENFKRLLDGTSEEEKGKARKQFTSDVKKHVDAIAAKYILPDEGTYDFALMYIPAENVYYETIIKDESPGGEKSISHYALGKKVIPVSPNSFYAYLQAIVMGLRGLRIEQRAKEIFQSLKRLEGDLERFREDFRLVGKHLGNAQSAYAGADKRLDQFGQKLLEADSEKKALPEPA